MLKVQGEKAFMNKSDFKLARTLKYALLVCNISAV